MTKILKLVKSWKPDQYFMQNIIIIIILHDGYDSINELFIGSLFSSVPGVVK